MGFLKVLSLLRVTVVRTGFEPVTSENPDWLQHIMLWPLSYLTIVAEIWAQHMITHACRFFCFRYSAVVSSSYLTPPFARHPEFSNGLYSTTRNQVNGVVRAGLEPATRNFLGSSPMARYPPILYVYQCLLPVFILAPRQFRHLTNQTSKTHLFRGKETQSNVFCVVSQGIEPWYRERPNIHVCRRTRTDLVPTWLCTGFFSISLRLARYRPKFIW